MRKKSAANSLRNAPTTSLLSGKCVDENGRPFTTTYTIKRKTRRYCYYLQKATNRRIRAEALDALAIAMLRSLAEAPEIWSAPLLSSIDRQSWALLWQHWEALPRATQQTVIQQVIDSAVVAPERLKLHLRASSIRTMLDSERLAPWLRSAAMAASQQASVTPTAIVQGDHITLTEPTNFAPPQRTIPTPNPTLIKALARSYRWNQLLDARKTTITAIARETKLGRPYVSRIINLRFLAPDIVEAILDGAQPVGLQLKRLKDGLPVGWEGQRHILGRRQKL